LAGIAADWQAMLLFLAVASLAVGHFVAIAQTNLQRMLAWSTIAPLGFVLLGLLPGTVAGRAGAVPTARGAALLCILTAALTTLGTFGLVQLLARRGFECDRIADLKGLHARSPWMALVMLLLMFSLAGIPPMVGFYAKLAVLTAAVEAGLVWLAVVAVLAS